MSLLRATQAILMVAMAAWLAALVTGGLSAAIVFSRLPQMPLALERFASWPVTDHGTLAAGLVMAEVFAAVDRLQLVAALVAVAALGVQHSLLGVAILRPSMLVRAASVTSAAALFGAYAIGVEPRMTGQLRDFWAAAESGDRARAEAVRGDFDRLHRAAATILEIECALVIVGIAASAVAFRPALDAAAPEPA